jgi:hypothetical protein
VRPGAPPWSGHRDLATLNNPLFFRKDSCTYTMNHFRQENLSGSRSLPLGASSGLISLGTTAAQAAAVRSPRPEPGSSRLGDNEPDLTGMSSPGRPRRPCGTRLGRGRGARHPPNGLAFAALTTFDIAVARGKVNAHGVVRHTTVRVVCLRQRHWLPDRFPGGCEMPRWFRAEAESPRRGSKGQRSRIVTILTECNGSLGLHLHTMLTLR